MSDRSPNKELAEMPGKDTATISKWVTNTSNPTLENLIEIDLRLKCDMNNLVRLDDVVPVKNQKQP
ncbi:MAG: helix-turn-helix domain-containing protein [Parabacteroides sp.]